MSYTADYPIHEGYDLEVFAEVEYEIHAGYNGGRDEPSEEAYAEVVSVQLYQTRRTILPPARWSDKPGWVRTDLGEAPQWVVDIINNDTDWLSEQAMSDGYGPDPDRLRDERIDLEMSER